jgi:hypothetical protein
MSFGGFPGLARGVPIDVNDGPDTILALADPKVVSASKWIGRVAIGELRGELRWVEQRSPVSVENRPLR